MKLFLGIWGTVCIVMGFLTFAGCIALINTIPTSFVFGVCLCSGIVIGEGFYYTQKAFSG